MKMINWKIENPWCLAQFQLIQSRPTSAENSSLFIRKTRHGILLDKNYSFPRHVPPTVFECIRNIAASTYSRSKC